MSTINVGKQDFPDMKTYGFMPQDSDEPLLSPINPKILDTGKEVNFIIGHEDGSMLEHRTVITLGRGKEEISKDIADLVKKGFRGNGQDFEKMDFIEVRTKPKLFIAKFKGLHKEFDDWYSGVRIERDGVPEQISEPHYRSWILGTSDLMGHVTLEENYEKILAYHRNSGRFSEVIETDWPTMKKMR